MGKNVLLLLLFVGLIVISSFVENVEGRRRKRRDGEGETDPSKIPPPPPIGPPPPLAPPPPLGGGLVRKPVPKSNLLPWQMISVKGQLTDSFFEKTDLSGVTFPAELLQAQFVAKKKEEKTPEKDKKKLVEVVTGTPRAAYASALKKLEWGSATKETVLASFKKWLEDNTAFAVPKDKEQEFSLLFNIVPPQKDINAILERDDLANVPQDQLAVLDKVILAIVSIPQVRTKMQSILDLSGFPESFTQFKKKSEDLLAQLREIKNSNKLKAIYKYALAFGRAVNGAGDGFRAANLLNLKKTSSPTTPGLTYLHLFVKFIQDNDPESLKLEKDIVNVQPNIRNQIGSVGEAVNEWKSKFDKVKKDDSGKGTPYENNKLGFLSANADKLQQLLTLVQQLETESSSVHKFYMSEQNDLGTLLKDFIIDIGVAQKDLNGKFKDLNLGSKTVTVTVTKTQPVSKPKPKKTYKRRDFHAEEEQETVEQEQTQLEEVNQEEEQEQVQDQLTFFTSTEDSANAVESVAETQLEEVQPEEEQVAEEASAQPEEEQAVEEASVQPEEEQVAEEASVQPEEEQVAEEASVQPEEEQVAEEASVQPEEEQVAEEAF